MTSRGDRNFSQAFRTKKKNHRLNAQRGDTDASLALTWHPIESRRTHVNHTIARHCCRRRVVNVLRFENDFTRRRHIQSIAIGQRQCFVVVQHRIQVLDPDTVDGAVEYQPYVLTWNEQTINTDDDANLMYENEYQLNSFSFSTFFATMRRKFRPSNHWLPHPICRTFVQPLSLSDSSASPCAVVPFG